MPKNDASQLYAPCWKRCVPWKMSPTPPHTPAASSAQMRTKLETILAYPFDCTLNFQAYEQVGATAAAPPTRLLALSACLALLPAVPFPVGSLEQVSSAAGRPGRVRRAR